VRGASKSLAVVNRIASQATANLEGGYDANHGLTLESVQTVAQLTESVRKVRNELATAAALLTKRDQAALTLAKVCAKR